MEERKKKVRSRFHSPRRLMNFAHPSNARFSTPGQNVVSLYLQKPWSLEPRDFRKFLLNPAIMVVFRSVYTRTRPLSTFYASAIRINRVSP